MAQAGVSIVCDFSLDSNGFFTPERRAIAQAAATGSISRMASTDWARFGLSAAGGSFTLADCVTGKGYLDFTPNSKTLGPGTGFWVSKPYQ